MKVCHMTSVHESTDDRIFLKECVSLAEAGFDTYQIAYGKSFEKNGVKVIGLGERASSRIKRILVNARRVYKEALKINADIYHFHDPELLPYGKKLKKQNKIVIYDSHEDVPRQIMAKEWIPLFCRKIVSMIYEKYEKSVAVKLDCVIAATPHIQKIFEDNGAVSYTVKNYPILCDIHGNNEDYSEREFYACYAGGLTEVRGITDIIKAMGSGSGKLLLAGSIDEEYEKELKCLNGYEKTKLLGFLNRTQIEEMYNRSRVGLAVLRKTPNHVNALAIKLFEYMAAGIPIVCSDFPLWIEIVEKNGCGICVEPENIEEIEKAIEYLFLHPYEAKKMGDRGKKVVREKYNWKMEEKRLVQVYRNL